MNPKENLSKIKGLKKESINLMHSEQIIKNIISGVKELVENAIDSEASKIIINLRDYGLSELEVIDNGQGIEKDDLLKLGKRGNTSKLKEKDFDLLEIEYLGFRGEALFGLVNLSEEMKVISKKKNCEAFIFDVKENILQRSSMNFEHGTKVVVRNLFFKHKIRSIDLKDNKVNYMKKILNLLKSYSLVHSYLEIRMMCYDKNKKLKLNYSKKGCEDKKENYKNILGERIFDNLKFFDYVNGESREKVEIVISNLISNDLSLKKNQIHMFINDRPILKIKKFSNILKKILNEKSLIKKFFLLLNITLPSKDIEFNLSKEKNQVGFHSEKKITEFLRSSFLNVIEELYKSVKNVNNDNKIIINTQDNIDKYITSSKKKINLEKEEEKFDKKMEQIKNNNFQNLENEENEENTKQKEENIKFKDLINLNNFQKKNFKDLKIKGQFNKGFIISQLDKNPNLYIIDQHAADEKNSYERMLNNLSYEKQKLTNSLKIQLTYSQFEIVSSNLSQFSDFGFQLNILENYNVEILTFPTYANLCLKIEEFYELLYCYEKSDINRFVYEKVKNIIASKACRYSIMIGESLSKNKMKEICENLSGLNAPFNCPHGRPTMFQIKKKKFETTEIEDFLYSF